MRVTRIERVSCRSCSWMLEEGEGDPVGAGIEHLKTCPQRDERVLRPGWSLFAQDTQLVVGWVEYGGPFHPFAPSLKFAPDSEEIPMNESYDRAVVTALLAQIRQDAVWARDCLVVSGGFQAGRSGDPGDRALVYIERILEDVGSLRSRFTHDACCSSWSLPGDLPLAICPNCDVAVPRLRLAAS